ncbi:MAG: RNA-directed DNA polymerase [Chitinivibrionia bacterium]|nr:RNA-directed DNA polymerase [Chitinivibrionia bacterium]MCL1947156.1 RNA-directed DNA polymerase [Chitinivibrionia bacterium]
MKRVGFLIEEIADINNLHKAFYKARKGKDLKKDVIEFRRNFDENIQKLHDEIISGNVNVGRHNYFKIYDPKERLICAASFDERVLHHAIINICHYYFEKYQIEDSFATRLGKGQYSALNRARLFMKKYKYFCKMDVRKYFDSISHEILLLRLSHIFKDKKLMKIFEKIIQSYKTKDGFGLPIGNLTSQYFANFYLTSADRFIKQKLRIKGYVRYMDDMVFWCDDKKETVDAAKKFCDFIENELNLKLKPNCINFCEKGLPFLGYALFENSVRLNKLSKRRFLSKYKNYTQKLEIGEWSQEDYVAHIRPLFAFTEYADTKSFREKILEK